MNSPIPSPDGRSAVVFDVYEMRMSHWVEAPVVLDTESGAVLFSLGDFPWSADGAAWSADSHRVTLALRRYPGDAPSVTIEVDLSRRSARIQAGGVQAVLPLDSAAGWLEDWYARQVK